MSHLRHRTHDVFQDAQEWIRSPKGGTYRNPFFRFLDGKTGDILDKDVLKPPKTCLVCFQGLIFNERITPQNGDFGPITLR